jgi:hypothetical protein
MNGDNLPKSFLQLKGISVGNFNMGCHFHISAAIRLLVQYNLQILVIQEHTSWNKELLEAERKSITKHCEKFGYFVTITKLQIVIFDKQLLACHRETTAFEEGRIICSRFQISKTQYVSFIPVYGIPHFSREFQQHHDENTIEHIKLQKMQSLKERLSSAINNASKTCDIIYVIGDLYKIHLIKASIFIGVLSALLIIH